MGSRSFGLFGNIAYLQFLKKFFGEIYIIALPAIAATLNSPRKNMQLVLSVYFLSVLSAQLLTGPLTDRFSHRTVLIALLPFFVLGNLICFLLNNVFTLYCGIALAGIGIGAAPTIGKALVFKHAKTIKKTTHLFVFISYVVVWAPAIGMLAGGHLSHYFGWHWIFILNCMLGILAFITTYLSVQKKTRISNPHPWHQEFRYYLLCLKIPKVAALLIATGCITSGIIIYYSLGLFYFHYTLKVPLSTIGYFSILIVMSNIIGKTMALYLIQHYKPVRIFYIGISLNVVAGIIMWYLAVVFSNHVLTILIPMIFYVIGVGIFMPVVRSYLFSENKEHTSTISSLTGVSIALCASVSNAFAAHAHIKHAQPLAMILLCLASIALLAVWIASSFFFAKTRG